MLASPLMSRTSKFFRIDAQLTELRNMPFGKILKFPPNMWKNNLLKFQVVRCLTR